MATPTHYLSPDPPSDRARKKINGMKNVNHGIEVLPANLGSGSFSKFQGDPVEFFWNTPTVSEYLDKNCFPLYSFLNFGAW